MEDSTWKNERRYLRHMVDYFEPVKGPKRLDITNPELIGPKEIRTIVNWMQDPTKHREGKPLDPDTQVRYPGEARKGPNRPTAMISSSG